MKKFIILLIAIITLSCSKDKGNINEIPFNQTNNLPIVTLNINGHYVRLLVDTGSTMNILDKSLKTKLRFTSDPSSIEFEGIGGNRNAEVVGNTLVKYKEDIVFIRFVTLDISNISKTTGIQGIIGSEFLEENGYMIDFKNNKLIK